MRNVNISELNFGLGHFLRGLSAGIPSQFIASKSVNMFYCAADPLGVSRDCLGIGKLVFIVNVVLYLRTLL